MIVMIVVFFTDHKKFRAEQKELALEEVNFQLSAKKPEQFIETVKQDCKKRVSKIGHLSVNGETCECMIKKVVNHEFLPRHDNMLSFLEKVNFEDERKLLIPNDYLVDFYMLGNFRANIYDYKTKTESFEMSFETRKKLAVKTMRAATRGCLKRAEFIDEDILFKTIHYYWPLERAVTDIKRMRDIQSNI